MAIRSSKLNSMSRTLNGSVAISAISTTFNNSGTVNVQSGTLRLSGGGTLSGTFNISSGATAQFNNAFLLTGIAVFFGGAVTGTGSISIGNGARAEFSSAVNGPAVTFASSSGTLTLDNPSTFQSPMSGLAIGDTINFLNTQVTSATINGSVLTISTTSQPLTYQVSGATAGNNFIIVSSNASGSQIVLAPSGGAGTVDVISGNLSAGSLSFAPTSSHLYRLDGANISGAGGRGFNVSSSDTNPADSIFVEINQASSISVSGAGFDGVRAITSGASVFIFNAAQINTAQVGINVVNQGSGSITISSGSITAGSSGIAAVNNSTTLAASANSTISVSASGSINAGTTLMSNGQQPDGIWAGYGNAASANPAVNGTVIINNSANITAPADRGINAFNFGNGNVTVNDAAGTTVSGLLYGISASTQSGGTGDLAINVAAGATIKSASSYGINAFSTNTGSISVTTSPGDIITGDSGSTGSTGINAVNEATTIPASANSSIVVTAYGTINSGSAVTGTGRPPAGILAGYLGGANNPTNPPLTTLNGDVVVNSFANITAGAGDGIRAYNYGIGDVAVNAAGTIVALGGVSPTNGYGVGIGAYNYGTGNISVSTAADLSIQSGSSGIFAINQALSTPSTSTVSVVAFGTITPGTIQTGGGNPAAGILAGYNFDLSPHSSIAGSVSIDDYGSIFAPASTDGIRGFNYGIGDIMINAELGATITGGRYGIAAVGWDGGDAHINNSATVSGPTAGIYGQATGAGTVTITNSSTGIIQSSGTSSNAAISIVDDVLGGAAISNAGIIKASAGSAAALAISAVGGSVAINNDAQIIGDVNVSNAIFNNNAGADWEFAGTNTFASGVNFINNHGTINSQGSLGSIQITAGSLDIVGTINGAVNLIIGNGATLELNGPGSAGETVTFLGSQGTLKLDHSLTSPFVGQISNLTGTALAHDNIDLVDLAWSSAASAQYASASATSGTLTVSDGNGHTEVFNLVNYSGAGIFFVQSDGQGGTLVFDPPDPTVAPAIEPLAIVTTQAELSLSGVNGSDTRGPPGPNDEPMSNFSSAFRGTGQIENVSSDIISDVNHLANWQFAFEEAPPNQPHLPDRSPSNHLGLLDGQSGNAALQAVSLPGGAVPDTFEFKIEMRTASPTNVDNFDLQHTVVENFAELHLTPPNHDGHDTLIKGGYGGVSTIDHVPLGQLHADGFMFI